MLVFCCVWQPHRAAWTLARGKYLYIRVCSVQLVRPGRERGTSVPFRPGGCVCFPPSFPPRPVRWGRSRGHLSAGSVLLSRACARGAPGAASRGGRPPPTFLPAPLIPLGKFTVNIFPGTLSSFWQSLSVCRTVKLSRRSKSWEICFYSNPQGLWKHKHKQKQQNHHQQKAGGDGGREAAPCVSGRHFKQPAKGDVPLLTWRLSSGPQPIRPPGRATWRATRARTAISSPPEPCHLECFTLFCMPNVPAECV